MQYTYTKYNSIYSNIFVSKLMMNFTQLMQRKVPCSQTNYLKIKNFSLTFTTVRLEEETWNSFGTFTTCGNGTAN